jgi:thiol-disulfide isomerase/thioredoxin
MTDRTSYVLLAAAAVALLAVHVAVKPGIRPIEVDAAAQSYGFASEWEGRLAEDFELPLRDGSTFHLLDHIGREVVVLNFFATWCEPCRAEMPELNAYPQRHGAASFVRLLGIDEEEQPDVVDAFVNRLRVTFPVGIDARAALARRFEVTAYPTTVVVGIDGRVKLYQVGAIRNADVALNRVVDAEAMALAGAHGDLRAAYATALEVESRTPRRGGFVPSDAAGTDGLSARAKRIAEAMPCPCGCADLRVAACGCQTAKGIKARLRDGIDPALTDKEVMEKLNREFCMKGM